MQLKRSSGKEFGSPKDILVENGVQELKNCHLSFFFP
jgi:hypothetical protein